MSSTPINGSKFPPPGAQSSQVPPASGRSSPQTTQATPPVSQHSDAFENGASKPEPGLGTTKGLAQPSGAPSPHNSAGQPPSPPADAAEAAALNEQPRAAGTHNDPPAYTEASSPGSATVGSVVDNELTEALTKLQVKPAFGNSHLQKLKGDGKYKFRFVDQANPGQVSEYIITVTPHDKIDDTNVMQVQRLAESVGALVAAAKKCDSSFKSCKYSAHAQSQRVQVVDSKGENRDIPDGDDLATALKQVLSRLGNESQLWATPAEPGNRTEPLASATDIQGSAAIQTGSDAAAPLDHRKNSAASLGQKNQNAEQQIKANAEQVERSVEQAATRAA